MRRKIWFHFHAYTVTTEYIDICYFYNYSTYSCGMDDMMYAVMMRRAVQEGVVSLVSGSQWRENEHTVKYNSEESLD